MPGDGTGGESIWGGNFEDEFTTKIRFDRPYTLAMANAGESRPGMVYQVLIRRTKDERQSILHHDCAVSMAERQAYVSVASWDRGRL